MNAPSLPRGHFLPSAFLTRVSTFALALGLFASLAQTAHAVSGVITGHAADAQVTELSGVKAVSGQTSAYLNIGRYWGGTSLGAVYVFQVPPAVLSDPSLQFTAANFSIKTGANNPTAFNGDLYGLGYTTSASVQASYFYQGALDTANIRVKDNFLVPSLAPNAVVSESGTDLIDYLNGQLAAARAASAASAYVCLRVSADTLPPQGGYYVLGMNEAGGTAAPTLGYTAEVVSGWKTVPLGGGGAVLGLIGAKTGPNSEVVYCRTDVGGAFRWNETARTWVCITDRMIDPTGSVDGINLNGINSLALDPVNPNTVYVAAGLSTGATPSGLYMTTDASVPNPTWTVINSAVRCSSNGDGKLFGERLAVDPNNPNVVYYGTNTASTGPVGLIKGVNSGGTWTWTHLSTLPNGTAKNGITFVACDKNGGATIVYAGVHGTGVYRSTDGGANWTLLSGGPSIPARGKVSPVNGTLYVTGNNTSVYTAARTATAMTATAISGAQQLVGLALDFSNADTALVADYKNGDEVWRSAAGSAWTLVNATKHTTDYDGTGPQTFTDGGKFSGTDELLIGPADSAHAWIAGGQGVMRTRNLTSSPSNWYPLQTGQEEVVVMDLATTPLPGDAELMAAVADNNGFYYPNVATRPAFRFGNPLPGNSTSLDFSEGNPDNWVRAWVNSDGVNGSGATSHDGGATWLVFGQAARLILPPGQAAGWDEWDLKPYLAQHTGQIVTLVIIPSSSPSSTATLTYESRTGVNKPTLVVNGTDYIASEDTYVNGLQTGSPVPNITNYGNETTLKTSYAYGMAQNAKWIYLKFDLTGVASVSSATLRLYRTTAQTAAATCAVGVFGCADTGWTETGLTYTNRPPTYASNHKAGSTPVANYDYDPYWYTSIRPPVYATNGTTRALGGRVVISPVNPSLIVWEPQYTTATMPLYYSKDRGVTWNTCLTTAGAIIPSKILDRWTPRPSVKNLTVDRVNGTFYYTSGSAGGSVSLLSSTDGATWTVLPNFGTGIYAGLYQLQSAPPQSASATACDLWFAYEGGAWVRRAGSTSWTKLTGVTAAQCLSFGKPSGATGYSTYIYGKAGGTLRGVYRLDNADAVTAPTPVFYGNPTTNEATALAGDRQSFGEVYFGTGGRGMFYYTP